MTMAISDWLNELGLGEYTETFIDNAIDTELLRELSDDDLKEMGISALGHRKRLLKAVANLDGSSAFDGSSTHTEAATTAWTRTPGERRPVTMLFADIVGSTALTEKPDAEDAHDRLYRAAQLMCEAIEANNGTVCRFMGDGVMAMFGAPQASERHALEACGAALDIKHRLSAYGRELQERSESGISIRIGLHSGEVVVLEVGDDPDHPEYDASGPAVALAARMEQSAPADTIQISAQTNRLAGHGIEAKVIAPVSVKGFSEPVEAWRLEGLRTQAEAHDITGFQPLVGRRVELAQFRGSIDACKHECQGQIVLIRGEAGIGKSRLARELVAIAEGKGFECHRIYVLDFGASKGQRLTPSLVRQLLGVDSGIGASGRARVLEKALSDGSVRDVDKVFYSDLLDIEQSLQGRTLYDAMDAETRNRGKHQAVGRLLARRAENASMVLLIEDLHWIDELSLGYLEHIASVVDELPILLVMTTRIDGDPIDSRWRASAGAVPIVTWDLGPLNSNDAEMLVDKLGKTDAQLVKRCVERSGGNPLFLEQLLLGMGESGEIPDSIVSMVLARIDQLNESDAQAIRAAAVLGQRFPLAALQFLLDNPAYDCTELTKRNLLQLDGEQGVFGHALIRDAAYGALLRRQRNWWHLRAAEWYTEHDQILHAEHLLHAGDERALEAYLDAAADQLRRFRPERAMQLVETALNIDGAYQHFGLLYQRAELLRLLGSIDESIVAFKHAETAASNSKERCRAMVGVGHCLDMISAYQPLMDLLEDAEPLARNAGLDNELAQIFILRGGSYFFEGRFDESLTVCEQGLQCARKSGSVELEVKALSGLGDAAYGDGRFGLSKTYFDQCLELARNNGIGQAVAANLPMRAILSMWLNHIDQSREHFFEAKELAEATGHLRAQLVALSSAMFHAEMGYIDEGEEWGRRGLEIARQLGNRMFEAELLTTLGRVAIFRGKREEAYRLLREAYALLGELDTGMAYFGAAICGALAWIATSEEDFLQALKEGEANLAAGSLSHCHINFCMDAIEACLERDKCNMAGRYCDLLEQYIGGENVPRVAFFHHRGRALIRSRNGDRSTELSTTLGELIDDAKTFRLFVWLPALEAAHRDFEVES